MLEIDILPASSEMKGADSILLRFEPDNANGFSKSGQVVVLIDGGYAENTERIISHLKSYYGTSLIDCVVCTHPDADHINGLIKLFESEEVEIHNLCVHDPWKHAYTVSRKVVDGRSTPNSVKSRLDDSLSALDDLLTLAEKKSVKIHNSYAGFNMYDGAISVIGPSKEYYCELVKQFPGLHEERFTPSDSELIEHTYDPRYDHFYGEPVTSAKNDSSMILYLNYDGFSVLFTGDCGVEGLEKACLFAKDNTINLKGINYLQIPHHGSIKNISKKLLDEISPQKAFVSAPMSSQKHPSRLVVNYLTKIKGIQVFHVSKNTIRISHKAPDREDWTSVKPLSIFERIFWPNG